MRGCTSKVNEVRDSCLNPKLSTRRCVMDKIVKAIKDGPGELDIFMEIRRRSGHNHPKFTFNRDKLPVSITSIGAAESDDPDAVDLVGYVLLNCSNQYQYHWFKARYNVRTRIGSAVFEITCRRCSAKVNEYGVCPNCDPCDRCHRRECQPKHSCLKQA